MRWFGLLLTLTLAGCVTRGGPVGAPPLRFDHPYAGEVVIRRVSIQEVRSSCFGGDAWACAIPGIGACSVYIYDRLGKKRTTRIIRHETGHCNGWPWNHPK